MNIVRRSCHTAATALILLELGAALWAHATESVPPLPVAGGPWSSLPGVPTARVGLAAASANGKIYTFGGFTGSYLATVEEYNPAFNSWAFKTPMPTARYAAAAAVVSGKIYVIGGGNLSGYLGTVEVYDPVANTWATKTPMPTPRGQLAAAVANGKIYVFGGSSFSPLIHATVEEYDPVADTWATKSSMPIPSDALAGVSVNGRVYALGGHNAGSPALAAVQEYDPTTNAWSAIAPMPTARVGLTAVVVAGKIHAIGGLNGSVLKTMEQYDPFSNTWASEASMPTARWLLASAEAGGNIHALGGDPGGGVTAAHERCIPPMAALTLQLVGVNTATTRCIHLQMNNCASIVVPLAFDATGQFLGDVALPCNTYTSLCAKDRQHSLASSVPLVSSGTDFVGAATLNLAGGDTDDDGDVDIHDITWLIVQFGLPTVPGPCPWDGTTRDADFGNDGAVLSDDYGILTASWLATSSCACSIASTWDPGDRPAPRLSVHGDDLVSRAADLTGDGSVDWADVRLFEYSNGLPHELSELMRAATPPAR